jgi:integrase
VHEIHLPTWRNAKHAAQVITTLETYAFPLFGKASVADVATADVLAALTPIWTVKPETAKRVRLRIGVVMKWIIAQGWRDDNPAESISQALPKPYARKVQNRKSVPCGDVVDVLAKVHASAAGVSTKLAFEFLVLTAARSGEVRGATWAEMDLSKAAWTIPGTRMKAKRPHRVPMSPRAIDLLRQAEALGDGSGLVFLGTKKGRPLFDMTLSKLLRELGVDAHVHGFRTSFKTWAQECTSFANEVSEMALAHVLPNKAEAAYAGSDLFKNDTC